MAKFWANFFGFFFFCLLLLGTYHLRWDGDADDHVKGVEQEFDYFEKVFSRAGMKLNLTYEEVEASGFPLSTQIRIYKPELRMNYRGHIYYLSMPYIDLDPKDKNLWLYEVQMPEKMTVSYKQSGGQQEVFQVFFSAMPRIWLRASEDTTKTNREHWDEYGAQLPNQLTMDVAVGQSTKRATYPLRGTQQPTWHYIPERIEGGVHYLVQLVRSVAYQQ